MPILTQRYTVQDVQNALMSPAEWNPFPRVSDRAAWQDLLSHPIHQRRADYLIGRAEALARVPFPALTATEYMRFIRTGDRDLFQGPYFERRCTLGTFVLAECFSGQRKFVDAFINAAWAITEEASWCLPAHAERDVNGALPTQKGHTVDLFAAETAMVLGEALYLMESTLLPEARAVADRIRQQIIERIIQPFETREFGWYSGRNNWTPWCASNITGAAMYVLDDAERLAKLVHKCMGLCDAFMDKYADDGGCDEGPTYWSVAPGALFMFLELVYSRSNGTLSIYDVPKLRRMMEYIGAAYMGKGRGLNFADAPPRMSTRPHLMHRFGSRVGMELGKEMAGLSMRAYVENGPVVNFIGGEACGSALTTRLREIFWVPTQTPTGSLRCPTTTWLPDLQVLIARQTPEPERGITFAIKGGHNQENHNHNDLGHFVLYVDGNPGVIDVGVENYTRKTFSSERYSIWCIRGSAHNAAVFEGVEQLNGRNYAAHETKVVRDDAEGTGVSMRLEKAYPRAAGLASYLRTGMLWRQKNRVVVTDAIAFEGVPKIPTWTFYTLEKPVAGAGEVRMAVGGRTLVMRYSGGLEEAKVEAVTLTDPWLKAGWGEVIYRVTLTGSGTAKEGEYGFEFEVV